MSILANIGVTLFVKTGLFNRKMRQSEKRLRQFSRNARSSAMSTQRFGRVLGAVLAGAVMARAIRNVAKLATTFASFESNMLRVKVLTGATEKEFQQMTAQAELLGRTTQFTAAQAAKGMSLLAQAGFKTNEIIGAIPNTLNLAAAGQLELADAAQISANILRGFSLEVKDLTRVNDVLTKTMTSATVDLMDLGETFKLVGGIAKIQEQSFGDMAAIIAKLGETGIRGSLAGTTLRRAIVNLIDPTAQAQKVLDRLSVSVKKSNGKIKSLVTIFDELKKAGADSVDVMRIFGDRAGPTLAKFMDEGVGGLRKLSAEVKAAGGFAKLVADTQMSGLTGSILRMKSAVNGVAIDLGRRLTPAFKAFNSKVIGLTVSFRKFIPELIREFKVFATQGVPAVKALLKQMGFLDDVTKSFGENLKAAFGGGGLGKNFESLLRSIVFIKNSLLGMKFILNELFSIFKLIGFAGKLAFQAIAIAAGMVSLAVFKTGEVIVKFLGSVVKRVADVMEFFGLQNKKMERTLMLIKDQRKEWKENGKVLREAVAETIDQSLGTMKDIVDTTAEIKDGWENYKAEVILSNLELEDSVKAMRNLSEEQAKRTKEFVQGEIKKQQALINTLKMQASAAAFGGGFGGDSLEKTLSMIPFFTEMEKKIAAATEKLKLLKTELGTFGEVLAGAGISGGGEETGGDPGGDPTGDPSGPFDFITRSLEAVNLALDLVAKNIEPFKERLKAAFEDLKTSTKSWAKSTQAASFSVAKTFFANSGTIINALGAMIKSKRLDIRATLIWGLQTASSQLLALAAVKSRISAEAGVKAAFYTAEASAAFGSGNFVAMAAFGKAAAGFATISAAAGAAAIGFGAAGAAAGLGASLLDTGGGGATDGAGGGISGQAGGTFGTTGISSDGATLGETADGGGRDRTSTFEFVNNTFIGLAPEEFVDDLMDRIRKRGEDGVTLIGTAG